MVLVILLSVTLAGCATTSAPNVTETLAPKVEKQLRITFVTPLIGHPVWLVAKDGMDAAAKEMGFTGEWVGPQGIDANEMVNQIENAIAQKVDGILMDAWVITK